MQGVEVLLTTYNTGGAIVCATLAVIGVIVVISSVILCKWNKKHSFYDSALFAIICLFGLILSIGTSYCAYCYKTKPYYTVRIDETASYLEFIEKYDVIKEVSDSVYEVREK